MVLVGSFALVSLAGCGRGFFQSAEREPWRAEAEVACLKSGAVKETADLVRINPISGPGVCGAECPLKVAALGESNSSFGFADELRPPAGIGGDQPRWPVSRPQPAAPVSSYPASSYPESAVRQQPAYGGGSNGPISLSAPGVAPDGGEIELPPDATPSAEMAPMNAPRYGSPVGRVDAYPQNDRYSSPPSYGRGPAASGSQDYSPLPRLGPSQGNPVNAFGPVAVTPTATLACPIVSALDRWLADSVQPSAMRWFGARVVEIKQISAYSCRSRNGDHSSRISEHAFGNALDIASFTLADGRRIVVERGWSGLPEEQGFLRDIQAAACRQFTTVLAPGSNAAHYNHIHVDLRKRSGRDICSPHAVSGEEVAARAGGRLAARQHQDEPAFTSSVSGARSPKKPLLAPDDDDD